MAYETLVIRHEKSTAEICLKGAYVRTLSLSGKELLKPSHDWRETHGGMAMLLPYANRVRNAEYDWNGRVYHLPRNNGEHSIHGLTRDVEWTVAHRGNNTISLWHKLETDQYPVPLYIKVGYSISSNSFTIEIEATNEGDIPAPFMAGMHPYFVFSDSWRLESPRMLLFMKYEDSYFPDGTVTPRLAGSISSGSGESYDNTFIAGQEVRLVSGDRNVMIRNNNMPFLVVYNGEYSEGTSVAIEPMTAAPDAFNNRIGLITIDPGEQFRCSAVFELQQ